VLKNDNQNEGFSLVELVIVIAVLAILSAVAIPTFTGVRNNAKVSAAKKSLVNILKECLAAESMLLRSPVFNDIASSNTGNSYGDRRGLNFGFTYDTELDSNTPISGTESCYRISAKSNTQNVNGSQVPILPHFEIFLDKTDNNKVKKNCSVASTNTVNNNYCDINAPDGAQW
jgi:prepilin-type N-terminal cleavage/methylation domain-containing protein